MATIIEIQENKLDSLTECAEKAMRYNSKLMKCLDELRYNKGYNEKYGRRYMEEEPDYHRYF
jgi:hypothetical protein